MHMKKKILLIVVLLFVGIISVYASSHFIFDISELSFISTKKKEVSGYFNKSYQLSSSMSGNDAGLEKKIQDLTKKTTYLLFGDFNNKNESSETYYKRKKDWFDLRYNPEVKRKNDTESKEYVDNLVSQFALSQVFDQASLLGLIYYSYGDIRIVIQNDMIISSITLPNVRIKVQSKNDPMKFDYVESDYVMHYYYKKLDQEWKLYYLYGEDVGEYEQYFEQVGSTESYIMSIAPSDITDLSTIYNFNKLNNVSQSQIQTIYDHNISNIVFLNSYYNNSVVSSANGFFINKGIIVTTWSFLEDCLINGQYIAIKNNNRNYELEGIVTINPKTDIAVLKVKNASSSFVKLGNYKNVKMEDPAFVISSKYGTGFVVQKGIILSSDDFIQTSIPLSKMDQGSPLFNQNGEVVGISTIKSINNNISFMIHSEILKEIQNKFNSIDYDKVEVISFQDLKEKYYYVKQDEEIIKNTIPEKKWKEYSKIGNIEKTIKLELVKASYEDKIVSLRYKNNISEYISSMQLAESFKEKLVHDGFKEVVSSEKKAIYKNNKYQVVIMDEFDCLIVVMVKL